MKRLVFAAPVLLLLLAPAASLVAQTPSATEILQRHRAARGGEDAWNAIRSLRVTGNYTALSEVAPFTLVRQRPDAWRFDFGILGENVTDAWADGEGWTLNPLEGWTWPVPLNRAQQRAVLGDALFDSPLMDSEAHGVAVEVVGPADFDGIDTWELKVTIPADAAMGGPVEETWHLDRESYRQVARIAPAVDFGRAVGTQTVFFDDHRQVAGVLFPFYMEAEFFIRHRVWEVEAIEVNPQVADGFFTRPMPAGMTTLAALAGDWHVTVEHRPAPQAPWTTSQTTARWEPRLKLGALEEHLVLDLQGRALNAIRTYTWDRFRDVYRLVQIDDLTQYANVYEGTWGGAGDENKSSGEESAVEAGPSNNGETDESAKTENSSGEETKPEGDLANALVLSNVETGTPVQLGGQTLHGRQILHDPSPDGFRMEWQMSTDGGETWVTNTRLTYSRQPPAPESEEEAEGEGEGDGSS